MRMSVNKEDPGYENLDYSAAVYLDGVLQRRVETAVLMPRLGLDAPARA